VPISPVTSLRTVCRRNQDIGDRPEIPERFLLHKTLIPIQADQASTTVFINMSHPHWNTSEISARKAELQQEEARLKNELGILKEEIDLSEEARAPRRFEIEKKIHDVRVLISRLPRVQEVIPKFETKFTLNRDEFQEFSEVVKGRRVEFCGRLDSTRIVDFFFTDESGYSQIQECLQKKKSICNAVESFGSEIYCEKVLSTVSTEFSFVAADPGTYYFLFDSPFQKRNETNEMSLNYTGYEIIDSPFGIASDAMTPDSRINSESSSNQFSMGPVVFHKEVVNQIIVRIPCKYCGNLNDQILTKCASCGASLK